MSAIKIRVDHNPNEAAIATLRTGIVEFNAQFLHEKATQFIITAHDSKNDIVGGATIWEHSDALYIDILWVNEAFRHRGVGSLVMSAIVEQANIKKIKKLFVDTYDFQASDFYTKQGFFIIGRLCDYLLGHDRIYLRKDIKDATIDSESSSLSEDEIDIEEDANDNVIHYLATKLKHFNESKVGPYQRKPFTLSLKAKTGNIIAGIKGDLFERICSIHIMWVDEQYRQRGYGKKLMLALEQFAKKKNCKFIQLDTAEFQAKGFYEKLGFTVIVTLPEGFLGYDQYIMRKIL